MITAYKKHKGNGFTLIELIMAVVIIGILSGVTLNVINIRKVQQRSRDARRIGDIKKVQTALELYFADTRTYPQSTGWVKITEAPLNSSLSNYIDKFPGDPNDGKTSDESSMACRGNSRLQGYYYITNTGGSRYVLNALMETTENAASSLCSSIYNCSGSSPPISCDSSGAYCYCVQNPL